jgi:hypothetical protein
MNRMILDNKGKPACARGRLGRTAALIATVALSACAAVRLDAVVFDDFEDPGRSATLWTNWVWNGTGTQTVASGHVKLEVTPPAGQGAFCNMASVQTWTLQEGRTLELRVDLLSSSADGALAWFGFYLNDGNRGYMMAVDQDTVALIKRESPAQAFFVTNGTPIKVSNVKLVVSMTGVQSGVQLRFKILDNDNAGAVILEREFLDTAGADPMQLGVDSPPASYLGATGSVTLSLFRDPQYIDPDVPLPPLTKVEVVYDNAEVSEYDVPSLEIANSVLLSCSPNTEEEQIVVGAGSVTSTNWMPLPEPVFKRFGQMSMVVPTTASQQFFKPVPGRQFADAFDQTWGPFTNRDSWMPFFQEAGEYCFVTNGVLQMIKTANASLGFGLAPLGTNAAATLRDCCASVDIVDWASSGNNSSDFALGGRGRFVSSTYAQGYFGFLTLNADGVAARVRPWIYTPSGATYGTAFDLHQFPLPYRLQFSAVGTQISLRVLNPATGQLIQQVSSSSSALPDGFAGLWLQGGANAGETNRISLDNFIVSGTKQ